jgi:hypothetical protein
MLSGFAGRGFIANIGVAIAHDESPFLGVGRNVQLPGLVGRLHNESAGRMRWFTAVRLRSRLLQQRKVKKPHRISNRLAFADVSCSETWWRHPMRSLSYIIALAFVLTGPSLAGSADRDLPGVGTFTYWERRL